MLSTRVPHQPEDGFYRPISRRAPAAGVVGKLLDFFEHGWVLTVVALVAGLIGVFVFAPVLVICGLVILAAFHRVGVVVGRPLKTQLWAYGLVVLTTGAALYGVDALLVKEVRTAADAMVNKIINRIPQQNASPIIVTPPPAAPTLPVEQPVVSVGATSVEHDADTGTTKLHVQLLNSSGVATMARLSSSASVDGTHAEMDVVNMPRGPVLMPPHGGIMHNIYFTPDKEQDKAIWDGTAKLEISVEVQYAKKRYKYIGRLNPKEKILVTLVSEPSGASRR